MAHICVNNKETINAEREFQVMWFLADFETVEALRAIIKITLILVSLDLVKVFISQESLGFSKSCRQQVIFSCLVLFS